MVRLLPLIGALALGACYDFRPMVTRLMEPTPVEAEDDFRPPDARPGACYGRDVTPALVETETRQVLVQPAQLDADGRVLSPAVYSTEERQVILREREEVVFETPCHDQLTADFVRSLQRALAARGLYAGPINGQMSPLTRRAVRRYQAPRGLDSGIVSIETARELGLVAVPLETSRG